MASGGGGGWKGFRTIFFEPYMEDTPADQHHVPCGFSGGA